MVLTALKSDAELARGDLLPGAARWEHFPEALRYLPPETLWGLTYLGNTALLVILNLIGVTLSSAVVAYGFARLRFPGRNVLFWALLASMMLPSAVTLLPSFLLFKSLGWVDTLRPLWVPSFFASAFYVFMLRQFFLSVPRELEDASALDGCTPLQTFWCVMLPQIRPGLGVVAIGTFLSTWNNFLGPLIYLGTPEKMPLAYALQLYQSDRGGEPALMMAFALMTLVPVLLVFFGAQRALFEHPTMRW